MIKIIGLYILLLGISVIYCNPIGIIEIIKVLAFSIGNTILLLGVFYLLTELGSFNNTASWKQKTAYFLLVPLWIITIANMIVLIANRNFDNFIIALPALTITYLNFSKRKLIQRNEEV
ncbi:hypothetical protein M2475_001974 [Breznakia sp. PF5-3]|uniref:hypothetical protein n=1 Tax=unclassified Breznakia TaxID=2623764 RepID=UPI002405877C|nr:MULTISPECIES: hypothetical protein [unclassified Breznakia]MDF9825527.1 hypothetical protein [Breznakia sp. PM6-1]MDF9836394.1 hypothetical protein [Breznakia sp. PF5-3]MDF9838951.1 hypothetical protein [Breznakia sp. PFB2-8]MDF9860546.1 hypothetical protein [Breznakia sp. PH5-24]